MDVRATLGAGTCGAALFIAQPVPYLVLHRISQAAHSAEPGTYAAQTTSDVLADLYYWTDPWWTAGVILFTVLLVFHRLFARGTTTTRRVLAPSILAQSCYLLPPLAAAAFSDATGRSTDRVDFVLVEFFFLGNGWIALGLALLFVVSATRRPATQRASDGPLNRDV